MKWFDRGRMLPRHAVKKWWRDTEQLASYVRILFRLQDVDFELMAFSLMSIVGPEVVKYVANLPYRASADCDTECQVIEGRSVLGLM